MIYRLAWLLLLVFVARARAEAPAKTALHWVRAVGAERCMDGRTAAQRVEALTGPVFVRPADAERSLEVEIAPTKRGYTARVVSVSASGSRSGERIVASEGKDCRALDTAATFVLALTIDAELARAGVPDEMLALFGEELAPEEALLAELEATPPAPVILPEPEPAAPVEPVVPKQAEVAPAPPARAPTRVSVGLGAALLSGIVPTVAPGIEASVAVGPPRFVPLALTGRAFPRGSRQTTGAGAARFEAYALALALCPLDVRLGPVRLGACLGPELTYLRGHGERFAGESRSDALWDPAVFGEALLAVALGRSLHLYGRALARVRTTGQRFVYREGEGRLATAFAPARVAPAFALGVAYAF